MPPKVFHATWPKMVFGHNLQHMAPFGILSTGFCMVFRHAFFVCSGSGLIFGARDPEFGPPDVPAGLGTFLGQKRGPEKDGFVEEMVPRGVKKGSGGGKWIVWCPGGHWASQFPPWALGGPWAWALGRALGLARAQSGFFFANTGMAYGPS